MLCPMVDVLSEIKIKVRRLRLIQLAMIAVVLISLSLPEFMLSQTSSRWTLWHWLVTGLAAGCIVEGFRFRHRLIPPFEKAFAEGAGTPKTLKRWEVGHVIGLWMAGAVAMYGLVLRMALHSTLWQALSFYLVGLFLLLLWTPRMPTAVGDKR